MFTGYLHFWSLSRSIFCGYAIIRIISGVIKEKESRLERMEKKSREGKGDCPLTPSPLEPSVTLTEGRDSRCFRWFCDLMEVERLAFKREVHSHVLRKAGMVPSDPEGGQSGECNSSTTRREIDKVRGGRSAGLVLVKEPFSKTYESVAKNKMESCGKIFCTPSRRAFGKITMRKERCDQNPVWNFLDFCLRFP